MSVTAKTPRSGPLVPLQPARMSTRSSSHHMPTDRSQGSTLDRLAEALLPAAAAAALLPGCAMGSEAVLGVLYNDWCFFGGAGCAVLCMGLRVVWSDCCCCPNTVAGWVPVIGGCCSQQKTVVGAIVHPYARRLSRSFPVDPFKHVQICCSPNRNKQLRVNHLCKTSSCFGRICIPTRLHWQQKTLGRRLATK